MESSDGDLVGKLASVGACALGDLAGKRRAGDGSRGSGLACGRNCSGGGERIWDLKTRSASP